MMLKKLLLKQIDYERWVNEIVLQALLEAQESEGRAVDLFGHLLALGQIWLDRVHGRPLQLGMWDIKTLEECQTLIAKNTQEWVAYLESKTEEELETYVEISFFGSPKRISILDGISTLLNHSSYHRGQIIQLLKGKLEKLPLTTYIAYAVEHP